MVCIQPIIQAKDWEGLQKTKTDFASVQTLLEDSTKLQGPWQTATQ